MKTYARIESGRVVEIIDMPDEMDPADIFAAELEVVEIPAGVMVHVRDAYLNGVFSTPAVAPEVTLPAAERIAALLKKVDEHLDAGAALRRYDNIRSAALRAGYAGPFHADGVIYATWMDATYAKCYEILARWEAGTIAEPTAEELIAMLPVLALG